MNSCTDVKRCLNGEKLLSDAEMQEIFAQVERETKLRQRVLAVVFIISFVVGFVLTSNI